MNLWQKFELVRRDASPSRGVSVHFEKGVDADFRKLCLQFMSWLRKTYTFPVHLNIYIKNCEKIRLLDGSMAYGGFRYFETRSPYIRIPAKTEVCFLEECEDWENYYAILGSLVHELTHYYQWVSNRELTEWQPNYYRFRILERFCWECDLPF